MKLFAIIAALSLTTAAYAQSTVSGDVPLTNITQQPGFSGIIHSWGFIGDSLSSGEHETTNPDGSTRYSDLYTYSWGQRLCQATGAKGENYSQGGETAHGWIEHFWDTSNNMNSNVNAKTSPKKGYIIALGVNDRNMGVPVGDVATDINKGDFTKNAKTFAGNYAGIIQRVKSIQPDAKIFVVTMARDGNDWGPYVDVIRQMPQQFDNVYLIDLQKYGPDYSEGSDIRNNFYMGGHLNAAGYQYTAWIMMNYIDWIIRHNMQDFSRVALIGTGIK
ncbi:MAG: SGNH/GDSL hydrolase family protein [Muribaculum sp.]|nr:SGNH/GDSL hydrolase family protein [Muribaculaceae bacterium]MCM1081126.1 SGNH/GDSL hydrolase family protein [Muribaculum sp.]MCM1255884.1 SGNH/GDSL hydrolase family protein [Duncaniella sp.]